MLRCTDKDCGHTWFERSALAEGADCECCGKPSELVGVDDEPPAALAASVTATHDRSQPAHARTKAREVAKQHGFVRPPVIVHKIARDLGFIVRSSHNLGTLRARLVGDGECRYIAGCGDWEEVLHREDTRGRVRRADGL